MGRSSTVRRSTASHRSATATRSSSARSGCASIGCVDEQLRSGHAGTAQDPRAHPATSSLARGAVASSGRGHDPRRQRFVVTCPAAAGVALLLLTFVLGTEINGQRLTLSFGPVSGQPSELLKVILVVFLAGYLSENRSLLVEQSTRIGPISLPPVPYLAPMVAMWAIALGIVVVQRDLGAALLFFAVFLLLLYTATGRAGYVVLGLILFVIGAFFMYQLVDHVRTRVDIWLDPFADPSA